jgi:hypothetical protein
MSHPSKTYPIPKYIVWVVICWLVVWPSYKIHDWWTHLNWPPSDLRNKVITSEISKKYGCSEGRNYTITKEILQGNPDATTRQTLGVDRQFFIDKPACAGIGLYLPFEGTGIREEFDVFDMTTKTRTAHIIITHKNFDQP